MNVFIVMAHRGGDSDNHTYCAAVCASEKEARESARECEEHRGGKYSCSVWSFRVGPFDGDTDPVCVLKERAIPGWKTAVQRLIEEKRWDEKKKQVIEQSDRDARRADKNANDCGTLLAACRSALCIILEEEGRPILDAADVLESAIEKVEGNGAKAAQP